MIKRELSNKLIYYASIYPVVSITGPRQSGKTTLVKQTFSDYEYITLEDIDTRNIAINDPKTILETKAKGLVIDEIQRVPELFSYIQGIVDKTNKAGQFIITGSQNFLLMENISQTLAGRIAILKLLPFSIEELKNTDKFSGNFTNAIYNGAYPRIYDKNILAKDFYPFYIQTYVERDVKLIKNINNHNAFINFIKICAGRTGQLLNISELANTCGITQITAKSWLSILEASYIIYFLQPYHKNYNKRIVKMPKLYFYDTGLASSILGIKSEKQLITHFLYGALFENFIINEFYKFLYNNSIDLNLYFWRNKNAKEIDLIIDNNNEVIPIEIKAGKTFNYDFLKNLNYWKKISNNDNSFVIYGGDKTYKTKDTNIISWKNLTSILDKILNINN